MYTKLNWKADKKLKIAEARTSFGEMMETFREKEKIPVTSFFFFFPLFQKKKKKPRALQGCRDTEICGKRVSYQHESET